MRYLLTLSFVTFLHPIFPGIASDFNSLNLQDNRPMECDALYDLNRVAFKAFKEGLYQRAAELRRFTRAENKSLGYQCWSKGTMGLRGSK